MAVLDQLESDAKAEGVEISYKNVLAMLDRDTAVELAGKAGSHFTGDGWNQLQRTLRHRAEMR